MKKYIAVALLLGATTIANGRETLMVPAVPQGAAIAYQANYSPTPAGEMTPVPATHPAGTIVCDACDAHGLELYCNVKYLTTRRMHPCAVEKIVSVPNPCYDPCNPCSGAPCVFVKICVPPCGCEHVSCGLNGRRLNYDYGQYGVRITVRGDKIVVVYT